MKKLISVIIAGSFLVLLFVLGANIYKTQKMRMYGFLAHENAELFVRDHSQTLGSTDAKVYLVKFSDPACETCSAFHPFVKQLMAANPGKIKLVIRYAPFHDGADYFVKILEAARKQGMYWETLDLMYKTQRFWASHHEPKPELIWQFLEATDLDIAKIKQDMNDPEIEKIIKQDLADAKTLQVDKTPGFFVNGRPLVQFGRNQLQQLVESEIGNQY